ncbi:NFYB/HAP3 family transcription factor subunit [Candidatus Woesearchaeota archaeon]|nr:NFYB/HAP3 family transcription factor subunit [Candidatus Woesearchaeota archaeon]
MLVVKSKIKEIVKDLNVSGDFAEALEKKAEHLIHEACERCKANGRRTVQARDL